MTVIYFTLATLIVVVPWLAAIMDNSSGDKQCVGRAPLVLSSDRLPYWERK